MINWLRNIFSRNRDITINVVLKGEVTHNINGLKVNADSIDNRDLSSTIKHAYEQSNLDLENIQIPVVNFGDDVK